MSVVVVVVVTHLLALINATFIAITITYYLEINSPARSAELSRGGVKLG